MVVRGDEALVIGGFTFGEEEDACSSLHLNGDSQLIETTITNRNSEPAARKKLCCFARALMHDHVHFMLQRPC